MSELGKKIEDAFAAAAFAEAGEVESARELARGSRKVLLALRGAPSDSKSFTYAMSVAKRIGAALEVMVFASRQTNAAVIQHYRELLEQSGIEYHFTNVRGCMKTEILEYTTKRSNIQFVVAESIDVFNNECQQETRSLRGALKNLRCPLVLVSEQSHE